MTADSELFGTETICYALEQKTRKLIPRGFTSTFRFHRGGGESGARLDSLAVARLRSPCGTMATKRKGSALYHGKPGSR